jgi:hypothetical protein
MALDPARVITEILESGEIVSEIPLTFENTYINNF